MPRGCLKGRDLDGGNSITGFYTILAGDDVNDPVADAARHTLGISISRGSRPRAITRP